MLDLYITFFHENDFDQTRHIDLTFDLLHRSYF